MHSQRLLTGLSLMISVALGAAARDDVAVPESASEFVQVGSKTGKFRQKGQDLFLSCNTYSCEYKPTWEEGTLFEVPDYQANSLGPIVEQTSRLCLDRESCHSDTSNLRLSECNHCGAHNWRFNPETGLLAEDWDNNAVDTSANVHHRWDSGTAWFDLATSKPCDHFESLEVGGRWEFFGEGVAATFTSTLSTTQSMGWSHTSSHATTASWGVSIKIKSLTKSLDKSTTTTLSDAFTSSLSTTEGTTCQVKFAKPSNRWRWVWQITDLEPGCGDSSRMLDSCIFVESDRMPACPPGLFDHSDGTYQTCTDSGFKLQSLLAVDMVVPEERSGQVTLVQAGTTKTGVFKKPDSEQYLYCSTGGCGYRSTYNEATEFVIPGYDNSGGHEIRLANNPNQCLDRRQCHAITSVMQLGPCTHCGALHWKFNPVNGMLGEDNMQNAWAGAYIHHASSSKYHPAVLTVVPRERCDPEVNDLQGRWEFFGDGAAVTFTEKLSTTQETGLTHSTERARSESHGSKNSKVLGQDWFGKNKKKSSTDTISDAFTSSFAKTATETCAVTFAGGSSRWRWVWTAVDGCGKASMIKTCNFIEANTVPACPPGLFDMNDKTYQKCVDPNLTTLSSVDVQQNGLGIRVLTDDGDA